MNEETTKKQANWQLKIEPDRKEDDVAVRGGAGQGDRVQRRVDDAHVGAAGLGGQQVDAVARHAQHVAERAEDGALRERQVHRLVDQVGAGDADRAAGAVDERDDGGQELVQAELHDGVGLAAADLHDRPGAGRLAGDGVGQPAHDAGVAVFVDVLHWARSSAAQAFAGPAAGAAPRPGPSPSPGPGSRPSSSPIVRR